MVKEKKRKKNRDRNRKEVEVFHFPIYLKFRKIKQKQKMYWAPLQMGDRRIKKEEEFLLEVKRDNEIRVKIEFLNFKIHLHKKEHQKLVGLIFKSQGGQSHANMQSCSKGVSTQRKLFRVRDTFFQILFILFQVIRDHKQKSTKDDYQCILSDQGF